MRFAGCLDRNGLVQAGIGGHQIALVMNTRNALMKPIKVSKMVTLLNAGSAAPTRLTASFRRRGATQYISECSFLGEELEHAGR
jgi:hypothetical protein